MKKCILIIFSVCTASFQLYAQRQPSRIETKNFSNVEAVHFDHLYGDITVMESDSKQIELEIRYFDGDDIKPVSKITEIDLIMLEKSTKIIKVLDIKTTKIPNISNSKRKQIGIDYIIAIPKDIVMNIRLKYGNVRMTDYYGDFKCDLAYSNLDAGDLLKSPALIVGKYSNINIGHIDTLDISLTYGDLNIFAIQTLKLKSKYSKCTVGDVKLMDAICSYGEINIGSITDFKADLRYTPTKIDDLKKSFNLVCTSSNTTIFNSSPEVQSIKFNGSHSNFELGLNAGLSANFDAELKYGTLSVEDLGIQYSFTDIDHTYVTRRGIIGNKTPTADITVKDSYASVLISNMIMQKIDLTVKNQRKTIEDNMRSIMLKRRIIDENMRIMSENIRIVNAKKRILEEKRRIMEEKRRIIDKKTNGTGNIKSIMEEEERIMKEEKRIMDEEARIMEEEERIMDERTHIIDERASKIDDETSEMDKEALKMDREALKMDREALKMDREAREMDREALKMDREAREMDREALKMDREALKMDEVKRAMDEVKRKMDDSLRKANPKIE